MSRVSYSVGDVVKFEGKKCIVAEASFNQGSVEYGLTELGWWYNHDQLKFVRKASKKTLKILQDIEDEEYDYGEDDEDET